LLSPHSSGTSTSFDLIEFDLSSMETVEEVEIFVILFYSCTILGSSFCMIYKNS
jgi:hypothetical protein